MRICSPHVCAVALSMLTGVCGTLHHHLNQILLPWPCLQFQGIHLHEFYWHPSKFNNNYSESAAVWPRASCGRGNQTSSTKHVVLIAVEGVVSHTVTWEHWPPFTNKSQQDNIAAWICHFKRIGPHKTRYCFSNNCIGNLKITSSSYKPSLQATLGPWSVSWSALSPWPVQGAPSE